MQWKARIPLGLVVGLVGEAVARQDWDTAVELAKAGIDGLATAEDPAVRTPVIQLYETLQRFYSQRGDVDKAKEMWQAIEDRKRT